MNCPHLDWALCKHCFAALTAPDHAAIQQADGSQAAFLRGEYRPLHVLPADIKTSEPDPSPAIAWVPVAEVVADVPPVAIRPPEAVPLAAPMVPATARKPKTATNQGSLF